MATVKSGINKVGNNYYQSITRDEPDGSVGTTFYRVNADGSGGVPIYDVDRSAGSTELFKSFDPNATEEEKRFLSDPSSQLSQVRAQQVRSSNPYTNPTQIQQSTVDQAGGGSGNTTTVDPNQPNVPGGSTPANPNPEESNQQQTGGGSLIYPEDLGSSGQDRIKFTVLEIARSTAVNPSQALSADAPSFTEIGPSVFLPIQSGISDQNSVNWGGGELNEIQRLLADKSIKVQRAGSQLGEVALSEFKDLTDRFRDSVANSGLANIYFAEQAVGIQNLLPRVTGNILNPNLELLFQGPTLRPFNFSFKMSPRSESEAKKVKSIINYFKKNMSVRKGQSSLFLKSPYVFKIEYQYGSTSPHPGLNLIKECALLNCSVDYTPLGTYMTYPDGTMVSYNLSLQFQEITPIYDTDYKDPNQIEF